MTKPQMRNIVRHGVVKKIGNSFHEKHSSNIVANMQTLLNDHPEINSIGLFYPTTTEPQILSLVRKLTKKYIVALPRLESAVEISFRVWNQSDRLTTNKYGILESPKTAFYFKPDQRCLIFVPCLAADIRGFRLGRGAGFYDRFLSAHSNSIFAAIVYDEFLYKKIPTESHDIQMNFIVTQTKIIEIPTTT